jgi:choline dehydrogenase-like flavoprotein
LRIADASVIPSSPSANTCAASMMIGEKAADLLLGRVASQPGIALDSQRLMPNQQTATIHS